MKELDTAGLCCCKNWMFELTTGERGKKETYRFYSFDPVMFRVNNSVVSLIIDRISAPRINLAYFLENFEIFPYRFVKSRNENDKKEYKMFEYRGDYWIENSTYAGEYDICNQKQFAAFFNEIVHYQVCKCMHDIDAELSNGRRITYPKGELLPFIVDKYNNIIIGKDETSKWNFNVFIKHFTLDLENNNMEELYKTYLQEFKDPFMGWQIDQNLFDDNFMKEYIENIGSLPEELVANLKSNNLLAGTDPDGGVIGERGEDGKEVIKHAQEISEGVIEIKTNMLR